MYTRPSTTLRPFWMTRKNERRKNTATREAKENIKFPTIKKMQKQTPTANERRDVVNKKREGPASLFFREAEVLFGALKTKSCLSEASSFCLA